MKGVGHLRKDELSALVAAECGMTKAAATRAIDSMCSIIVEAVSQGEAVSIVNFGTWELKKRGARTGRNMATGEEIHIKEKWKPTFVPGRDFKKITY